MHLPRSHEPARSFRRHPPPLDRESLPPGKLDIAERVRTNPFPWTGQFSPQLADALLTAYAPRTGVVLDPFAGSGTSLVEAARQGLEVCGVEIDPAAMLMARVYQMINLLGEKVSDSLLAVAEIS